MPQQEPVRVYVCMYVYADWCEHGTEQPYAACCHPANQGLNPGLRKLQRHYVMAAIRWHRKCQWAGGEQEKRSFKKVPTGWRKAAARRCDVMSRAVWLVMRGAAFDNAESCTNRADSTVAREIDNTTKKLTSVGLATRRVQLVKMPKKYEQHSRNIEARGNTVHEFRTVQ
ncbi:unnamed protein product [Anisakis simplex]|uniref:HTH_48 domain-containing protein n=1 Tax=Anisakis simplex TaxID=6269 RepID=A0A0M3JVL7_ANISI|nr:unnamed protein product [Anisakis simplex]